MNEFTDKQKAFLNALWTDECAGDIRKAMDAAGYSKSTPQEDVVRPLRDAILERAEMVLASNAPKAALRLGTVLDGGALPGSEKIIMAAKEVLDRVGLVKREKITVEGGSMAAIIYLPPKDNA